MKYVYLLILSTSLSLAQVGINTETPNALLEIKSSDELAPSNMDGLLIPKIEEFPLINPTTLQDGMMIFVTGAGTVSRGFYYWDDSITNWSAVSSSAVLDHDWYEESTTTSPNNINDNTYTLGNVAIGKNTADYTLDIESNSGVRSISNLFTGNTTGSSFIYGVHNNVIDNGDGFAIGTYNDVEGGTGTKIGTFNNPGNSAMNNTTGTVNQLFNLIGNGTQYGTEQRLHNNGGGIRYGTYNGINGTQATGGASSQPVYGSYQYMGILSQGDHFGSYNNMTGNGFSTGNIYGTYNDLNASTQANQYGSYNIVNIPSASGTNYGVFSQALFPNSHAGYFLGNVTIGTTTANTYTLPTTRGTADQIIQTDGAGNTTWADASTMGAERINDLIDGKSDNDGTDDGSSIFLGIDAGLNDDTTNNLNIGMGYQALQSNIDGSNNTAIGYRALSNNISAHFNTAVGTEALLHTNAGGNVGIGKGALQENITGFSNVAVGNSALRSNINSINNIAIGYAAFSFQAAGTNNIAIGNNAGRNMISGSNNIFIGNEAAESVNLSISDKLYIENSNSTAPLIYGEFNNNILGFNGDVAIGHQTPLSPLHIINEGTSGVQNIVATLGSDTSNRPVLQFSETTTTGLTEGMSLEYDGRGAGGANRMVINNIGGNPLFEFRNGGSFTLTEGSMYVNHPSGAATEGLILRNTTDADNWRLYTQWNSNTLALMFNNVNVGNFDDVSGIYTAVSDRNLKKNITPTDNVLEKIKTLEVVDYNFKTLSDDKKYTGLIAQEVEKLFPSLVVPPNEESENYTMDYSGFGVLAIKAIQEQQQKIEVLEKEIAEIKLLLISKKDD